MWRLVLIVLSSSILLLTSCKIKKEVITVTEVKDSLVYVNEVTTEYDTISIPPDSAWLKAYLKCDSLGNVYIKELSESTGKLRTEVKFVNDTFFYQVSVDSQNIIRQAEKIWKENYSFKQSLLEEKKLKEKRLGFFNIYFFAGLAIGILILIAYIYLKRFFFP